MKIRLSKIDIFGGLLGLAVMAAALTLGYSKTLRDRVTSKIYKKNERTLLATVTGRFSGNQIYTIAKYSTYTGILIEVYQTSPEGGVKNLVDRVFLGDRKNAYFQINGESVQLALVDLTKDGSKELIAPTFDERLRAHLNAYQFDESLSRLVPLEAEQ